MILQIKFKDNEMYSVNAPGVTLDVRQENGFWKVQGRVPDGVDDLEIVDFETGETKMVRTFEIGYFSAESVKHITAGPDQQPEAAKMQGKILRPPAGGLRDLSKKV